MIKMRIEAGRAHEGAQKYIMCEFCNTESDFRFSAPLFCKKCERPVVHAQKILGKKASAVNMVYAIKWHFSKRGDSVW